MQAILSKTNAMPKILFEYRVSPPLWLLLFRPFYSLNRIYIPNKICYTIENKDFSFGGEYMTEKLTKRTRLIYGVLLSAVLILTGVCLMAACIDIYRAGDHPYSRAAVAAHFGPISPLVYLCIAMVIGGFILDLFLPKKRKGLTTGKQDALILARLRAKADMAACDQSLRAAITIQQKRRKVCRNLCAAVMALCAFIFLIYALNGSHFLMPDINGSMIRAMYVLLPCLIIAFGCAVLNVCFSRASIRKEIDLLKQAPAAKAAIRGTTDDAGYSQKKLAAVRYAIVLVGVGLLLYGFFTGGTADVLTKAINICTECVGLG